MISKKWAEEFNKIIAEATGGSSGIRDEKLLLSALNRPFQTFDGKDLYPSTIEKRPPYFRALSLTTRSWMGIKEWPMLL